MKKYILKAVAGIGGPEEEILGHWNEEIFKRYQNNELSREEDAELVTLAHDLMGFECWVEEIEE